MSDESIRLLGIVFCVVDIKRNGQIWLQGVLAAVAATFCCCFSSTARISLENGETKTMSQLKIGDKVKGGI